MFYTKRKRSSFQFYNSNIFVSLLLYWEMRRYCFCKYFGPLIVFRNQIRTWSSIYDNQASCCILFKSISNFLRYGVLKISFGRGLRSIWAILVNIELDLPFMITKLPAKFHRNRSRTFWVILITDRQKNRKKNRRTHTTKTIPLSQTEFGAR